jgi:hypothetical protein
MTIPWVCAPYSYDSTTGNYIGTKSLNVGGNIISGEYLIFQSNVAFSFNQYTMNCSSTSTFYNPVLPLSWYLLGSKDGQFWNSLSFTSYSGFPGTKDFTVTNTNIYEYYAFLFINSRPNKLGAVQVNQIYFSGGVSYSTSKTFQALGNVYTTSPGYIQQINLDTFSPTKLLTGVDGNPIVELYTSNTVLMGTSNGNVRLFTLDTSQTLNVTYVASQVLSTTSDESNIFVSYEGNIRRYDLTSNDYNQLGIWTTNSTTIPENLNTCTNTYALTDNTLYEIQTSTSINLGTQKYKTLVSENSNVFVVPSDGSDVKKIVNTTVTDTYTLPESNAFVSSSVYKSNIYLASHTNNLYSIDTVTSSIISSDVWTGQQISNIQTFNSNVYFFTNSNILVYDEASQNFSNTSLAANLIFSDVTSSSNGFMVSGNNLIDITSGIQRSDEIWFKQRGIWTYKVSTSQVTSALEWFRSGTPAPILQSSQVLYGNIFSSVSSFSVIDVYLTSSGSTSVTISSNANVYAYYNSTLTHETSKYFKLELKINGTVRQTFDGLYSTSSHLASIISNIKSHNVGSYSIGFTDTTSSQFIVKVFGSQGSDTIAVSGLTSIGAASNVSTVTNGTTISITPSIPIGLSNTLSVTAYSPFRIYADGPLRLNSPYAFTTNTSSSVGSRYTQGTDGTVFATAPFIPRFANNFLATRDNSLILKVQTNAYTVFNVDEFSSSNPLYTNVYSYGDTLYFFSASDGVSKNLIGIFDSVNQTMTHVNVYQYCSTGEVYSVVYNAGVLYALSGDSSVSNVVYIIATTVFNISDLVTHEQIHGSVVSGPLLDGVFFVQKDQSNILCLNTTISAVYDNKLDTDICDVSYIGSTYTYFYGSNSSNVYSINKNSTVNSLSISTNGIRNINFVTEYNSSVWYSNTTNVFQNSSVYPLGATVNSSGTFIKNGVLTVPSNDSNVLVFYKTYPGAKINDPFKVIYKPNSNLYSVVNSNVYMLSSPISIFDMNTQKVTVTKNQVPSGAIRYTWVNSDQYVIYPNLVKNLTMGSNLTTSDTILDVSSDSLNRLILLGSSNIYQIENNILYTSPIKNMNVVYQTTFVNNSSFVQYTPTTPTTLNLGPHNAYELNVIESNVYAQLDQSIVSFSKDLKYYCDIAPLAGIPVNSVYCASNLVYLTQGQVIYINPYTQASVVQNISPKFTGQLVIDPSSNTIYVSSSTDINLLRLPSNTETTRRYINTTARNIGSTFFKDSNVYSFATNNQTLIFKTDAIHGYSQTFPYTVTNSVYLNNKIYYTCIANQISLASNIIQQDITKDFWLNTTYSNITATLQTISSLSTFGKNVVAAGSTNLYIYDTINSKLSTLQNASNQPNFINFDGKSFLLTKSNTSNVLRYTPNTIGTFTTYDIIPPVRPDNISSFAFDGKYLYTMSNIVYTTDTSNLNEFVLTRQPDFPLLSNVVGGFFDGQSLNVYLSNTYFKYDLSPFMLNANCSMSAIVQYAYLSEEEKRWMNSGPLDYVVTQVQQSVIDDGYYMVDFLNPTKEIILTGPLDALKVFVNGNLLVNPDTRYMSNVNQLQYHSRRSTFQNTYAVSFSLAPEKNIPSGHLNLSRIKEKVFASETQGPVNIFSLSHNIFRARDGLGGLVFNNRFN